MNKINLSEKQLNMVYLIGLVLLLTPGILYIVDSKIGLIGNPDLLLSANKFILWYVLVPVFVLIKLGQWVNVIPVYQPNALKVIWPNFNQENYPRYFLFTKVFNVVIIILALLVAYLAFNNKI